MTSNRKQHKNTPYGAYYKTDIPSHDPELTHTDRGTPMGEYLRCHWQPICLSEQLTDVPLAIRIMGEDLVVFRDGASQIGLLQRHCCHRGTSLEFGIIQSKGIRCCLHGWVFDVDGTVIETPCEPAGSRLKETVRARIPRLREMGWSSPTWGHRRTSHRFPTSIPTTDRRATNWWRCQHIMSVTGSR